MSIKKKLGSIIAGWKNLLIKDEFLEELFLNRMRDGCNNCEYNVFQDILKTCSICKCPLASKTRSLSEECPHPDGSKWKPILRYDEKGEYRLTKELPVNLQKYFEWDVIEESQWQEFIKHYDKKE